MGTLAPLSEGPLGSVAAVVTLGVLDQSPVPDGTTPAEALRNTVSLAQAAEQLGYRRYWLAEHHNTASLAGTAPEVLAAHVAGHTSTIRVGAGGVLLPYYSPLKVAEAFRTLNALFPGRIDLGLGRAAGTDAGAQAALLTGSEPDDDAYEARVGDLMGYLSGGIAGVRAMPVDDDAPPEIWVLSSSTYGCELAARAGLGLSFAHFVTPDVGPQLVADYRRHFRPSAMFPAPRVTVGVSVLCAGSDDEAERLAVSHDVWRLRPEGAARGALLSVEDAAAYPLSDLDRERIAQGRRKRVVGGPETVRNSVGRLLAEYDADQLMVVTICHDHQARLRSCELVAELFDGGVPM